MAKKNKCLSKRDVVEEALKILKKYDHEENATDILDQIRSDKKIQIEYCLSASQVESLEIEDDGSATIFLPHDSSAVRDRFTIAHELGHYFLHWEQGTKESFTRRGSDRYEWEANWFAAELLMPQEKFLALAKKTNNNLMTLAFHFNVSTMAAQVRLESLTK